MALNTAALTAAGGGLADVITHIALHTAQPDGTGSNPAASARQPVSWTNTDGVLTSGTLNFTGVAASGAVTHIGYWGALTGGTFYGWHAITGDQAANAAGEFTVTQATLTGSAT
mgnify:CR=1 FL=1